jgi:hypothetical protein
LTSSAGSTGGSHSRPCSSRDRLPPANESAITNEGLLLGRRRSTQLRTPAPPGRRPRAGVTTRRNPPCRIAQPSWHASLMGVALDCGGQADPAVSIDVSGRSVRRSVLEHSPCKAFSRCLASATSRISDWKKECVILKKGATPVLRKLISAAVLAAAFTVPASAVADPGPHGPGTCIGPPGPTVSPAKNPQFPPPNAGPNSPSTWEVATGAPNSPGQSLKFICH